MYQLFNQHANLIQDYIRSQTTAMQTDMDNLNLSAKTSLLRTLPRGQSVLKIWPIKRVGSDGLALFHTSVVLDSPSFKHFRITAAGHASAPYWGLHTWLHWKLLRLYPWDVGFSVGSQSRYTDSLIKVNNDVTFTYYMKTQLPRSKNDQISLEEQK